MTADSRVRFAPALVASVATLFACAHAYWSWPWTVDDVFITLRYSRNVVAGLGPVYNVGEPVEGYTCPLWMWAMAGLHAAGLKLIVAARYSSMLFGIATLWLLAASARLAPRSISPTAAAVAVALTVTSAPFVNWASTGMETASFACFVSWMVIAYLRHLERPTVARALAVAVAGGLCALTRPDAAVFVAVLGVHRIMLDVRQRERWSLVLLVGLLVIYAPYFAWRWSYYGHMLPNTFYAKVTDNAAQVIRGTTYVLEGISVIFPVLMVPLSLVLLRTFGTATNLLCVLLVARFAYIASVGGDHFPVWRFFVPAVPLGALATGIVLDRVLESRMRLLRISAILLALNLITLRAHEDYRIVHVQKGWVAREGKIVGEWLKANVPPGSLLATNAAGALAYYSELPIVDMLGLNDEHIAHKKMERMGGGFVGHEKADGVYVFDRDPDYVMFQSSKGAKRPAFESDRQLFRHPGFKKKYALDVVKVDKLRVFIYRKRELPSLKPPKPKRKRQAKTKAKSSVNKPAKSQPIASPTEPNPPKQPAGNEQPTRVYKPGT